MLNIQLFAVSFRCRFRPCKYTLISRYMQASSREIPVACVPTRLRYPRRFCGVYARGQIFNHLIFNTLYLQESEKVRNFAV